MTSTYFFKRWCCNSMTIQWNWFMLNVSNIKELLIFPFNKVSNVFAKNIVIPSNCCNVKTLRLKKFQILFYFIFIHRRINVSAEIVHVIWLIGQEWPYVLKSKHSCFNSENNKHICNHSLPFSCIKENGTTLN